MAYANGQCVRSYEWLTDNVTKFHGWSLLVDYSLVEALFGWRDYPRLKAFLNITYIQTVHVYYTVLAKKRTM